jgi:Enterobacter phage Enc34, ssDNA-binding protein
MTDTSFDTTQSRDPVQPVKDPYLVITPECRFSHVHVFKPRVGPNGEDPSYSIVAVFPAGTNLQKMYAAARAAAVSKWGDKADAMIRSGQIRSPFRKGSDRQGQEGYAPDSVFVTMRRPAEKNKPGILAADAKTHIESGELFYSGCYGYVSCRAFPYDQRGNKGVSFGLINCQKSKDGPRLDNQRAPEQDFSPLPGAEGGGFGPGGGSGDDDIPF